MSFDDQTFKRKTSLFRQSLRFQEIAANVFVQRVPVRYLKRLYDEESDDPVVEALHDLDTIFADCKHKSVDVAASVEAILDESKRGAVLLAWHMGFDAQRRTLNAPQLVGIATLSEFLSTPAYSTDDASISQGDFAALQRYFRGNWMYIDCMCSTRSGVGRLLVLHAYAYALAQRSDGVIALAYSARRASAPESRRIFDALGFETVIAEADFAVRMYGSWHAKSTGDVDLSGMAEDGVRVCTRTGLTPRTADTLMWRCPA